MKRNSPQFVLVCWAFIFIFGFAFSPSSWSQKDARRLRIDATRPIRISYESTAWNKNSNSIDTAYVVIRDANTGQIARVLLSETGANTGVFSGAYQVSNAGDASEITPELYVPPQDQVKNIDNLNSIKKNIEEGELVRKPFFMREENKGQTITLCDTKEQAYEAYSKHMQALGKAVLEARKASDAASEQKRLAEAAEKAANDRQKLQLAENQRVEELRKQMAEMSAEEKNRRKTEASRLAHIGYNQYTKNNFGEAEKNYAAAYELDPENNQYFVQYGATLYRNKKYNRSLVMLNLAEGEGVNPAEKELYRGLDYMSLEDNDNAATSLTNSMNQNDKNFSPTAALYAGVVLFKQEKYEESKKRFEWVLDNSSDPAQDKQAEAYIEQIASAMKFKEMKDKPWTLTLNLGLIRDSNILNVSSQSTTSNLEGYRWMYGGSLERRLIINDRRQWSGIFTYTDMYSVNNSFAAETAFQNLDPRSMTLYFPYKQNNTVSGKVGQWGLNVGYETINMNADGTGDRENITNSWVLKTDQTIVMRPNWISNYSFEYHSDTSLITAATPASDLNATQYTLGTSQTFFRDEKMTQAMIADWSYNRNNTTGADVRFNKWEVGGTYLRPGAWDSVWTTRLAYFQKPYPDSSTSRKDWGYTLTSALSKPLTKSLSSSFSATYNDNRSNIDANQYNKYSLLALLSWTTNF